MAIRPVAALVFPELCFDLLRVAYQEKFLMCRYSRSAMTRSSDKIRRPKSPPLHPKAIFIDTNFGEL